MKDRYQVGDLVGRGGMGQVHIARHRAGHLVVIKRVRHTLSSDELIHQRLEIEGRLLGRVQHPNVVRALDTGHDDTDGTPYLVMDRAHGTPLDAVIAKTGPLPLARIAAIASQLLAGLAAIHDAGIVHADIKSSNVMVDDNDHVVIIDFGLARTRTSADLDGRIAGTPSYMAPEVISGEVPTYAADLFGAGAIIYEMLTGTPPFTGMLTAILARQLADEIDPPSLRVPLGTIGRVIDGVVLRALSRDAARRYPSARAFAAALAEAFSPQPESVTLDLIELIATRDFWNGETQRIVAARIDEETITRALETVRELVDARDHDAAIAALERALDELRVRADEAEITAEAWRLESVLAALYDHRGRTDAAQRMARAAHAHATRTGLEGATLRTRELLAKLATRPRSRLARGSSYEP